MKKISVVISLFLICTGFWSCTSVSKGEKKNCWMASIVDDNVCLDNESFVNGTISGEIHIDLLWSFSETSYNNLIINAGVWTPRSQEYIPYSTIYLVKKGKRGYDITDTVHLGDSTGHVSFEIEKQKLKEYFLAVYAPGCRSMIYQVYHTKCTRQNCSI